MRKAKAERITKAAADKEAVYVPDTCRENEVLGCELPIDRIEPSPFQPRLNFPEEEIERLAASIATSGLIHPIAVREDPEKLNTYELVDGERRLRACRRLGLATIRCEVGQYTDAQVMAIVVATALQRAELNPIEEALAFRRAIDAGVAAGPTELARQLGVSQGHVSNRIRLLELPSHWQERVISGEIPPTHARCLLKYVAYPGILAEVAVDIVGNPDIQGCQCSVRDFEEHIDSIAIDASRQLKGDYWDQKTHNRIPVFTPTAEQLEELQVIEITPRWSSPEKRAMNVKLWEQLQGEFLKSREAKARKKEAKAEAKAKQPKQELTPAEKKAAAAEERRKAAERARVFAKRLYEWQLDWWRYLIATRLREDATTQELLVIAVYFRTLHTSGSFSPLDRLKEICKTEAPTVNVKIKSGHWGKTIDAIDALTQLGERDIEEVLGQTMAEWFCTIDGEPVHVAYPEDLEPLATYLGVIRSAEWAADQAGLMSEAYWTLHSKDQLQELAGELGVEVDPGAKKSDLVAAFLARRGQEPVPMPAELTSVKRPK